MTSALLLVLIGCGPGPSPDIGVDTGPGCGMSDGGPSAVLLELLEPEGCRYAVSATDRTGSYQLVLDVPAFAEAATGTAVSAVYTLPDETVRLELRAGCGMNQCGDEGSAGVVSRTYTPTSGTVSVDVTPDGEEADAVVVFTEVNLVDEYESTTTFDTTWDVRLYASE